MLNIGPLELIMIAVVALVVVGPRRLPEIGRQAGKMIRDLRRMQDEVKDTIRFDLDPDDETDEGDEPPATRVRSSARTSRAHREDPAGKGDDEGDEETDEPSRPVSASDAARAQTRAQERRAAAGQDGDPETVPDAEPATPSSNGSTPPADEVP
jgi:sec-independent protein translocase protein TatB